MPPKIHAITAPFPGVHRWLDAGARLGYWSLTVLEDGTREIPTADHYLLGAWHPEYEPILKKLQRGSAKVGIAWSSSPQESDTSRTQGELHVLRRLTNPETPHRPDYWATLHPSMATILPNAFHLPAPIWIEPHTPRTKEPWIAFMSPGTEKKAVFSQLIATRNFQREHPEVELQTNLHDYQPILDWLGINYTLRPWLPHDKLLDLLGQCRLSLNASLAESWGYSIVDALNAGTHVIGSPTTPWLPPSTCVQNPNDPNNILTLMNLNYEHPLYVPKAHLERVAHRQNTLVKQALQHFPQPNTP